MDEVRFGSSREAGLPSRRLRALAVGASVAGVAAAGVAYAVIANSAHHPMTSQPAVAQSAAALPDPARLLPSAGCSPAQADWPSLAGLPASMRPGALPVIVDAQFSGRCLAPG
ncbi:hypothetical protein EAS64_05055 [Trebonia kvetii]|uniref:Uncharacterized protein n=1 Tax=Trebonia kvetii TaxID=2480626 RepID=A0A6P2C6X5_9ACTN|nr:hypothetical protein [Trebonia kvetii]TVZ06737.1 hypothetical protein EAS64_05055 [Trebonia kvetii]